MIAFRPLILCAILLIALLSSYQVAKFAAASRAQSILTSFGFPHAKIENFSIGPRTVTLKTISLDSHGFSAIDSIIAEISWAEFLRTGKARALTISGLKATILPNAESMMSASAVLDALMNPEPAYDSLLLEKSVFDVSTELGDLRFEAAALITTPKEGQTQTVQVRINAAQFQLSFETEWTGFIVPGQSVVLQGKVTQGRINSPSIRLSRFNGWLDFQGRPGETPILSGQLDAGSAEILDLPFQNLSLMLDMGILDQNLVLKAGLSGAPTVRLAADYTKKGAAARAGLTVDIPDTKEIAPVLEKTYPDTSGRYRDLLAKIRNVTLEVPYLVERRFAGGPYPFELRATNKNGATYAQGHFLVYPTWDVRGSLDIDKDLTPAFVKAFALDNTRLQAGVLRLDGSLKSCLDMN